MEGLMMNCKNWGSGICKPEIRRYNSNTSYIEEPVELPGPTLMAVYDAICRVCPNFENINQPSN